MSRTAIAVAMTGASGAAYGLRLVECLLQAEQQVYFMVSPPAQLVIAMETDLKLTGQCEAIKATLLAQFGGRDEQLQVFSKEQWTAPVASGSNAPRAMVVCPCSSGTLSAIATGASNSLLERAADVVLKERRQLILVHRETPLSDIHLENMLKLSRMGATILPASPGFYHRPQSVAEVVDFVV
ncbi:MAG: 3-octaprenyl-4-hydroxybenzoate carboxy-lyase UbiX, partial [Halothiobacillaceae bacterium]